MPRNISLKEFLLSSVAPSPERPVWLYFVGLFATVMITSWIADYLKDDLRPFVYGWPGLIAIWVVMVGVAFIAYWLHKRFGKGHPIYQLSLEATTDFIRPARGLVLFLSPLKAGDVGDLEKYWETGGGSVMSAPENVWNALRIALGVNGTWDQIKNGASNVVPPLTALEVHQKLGHCWLITTNESRAIAPLVERLVRDFGWVSSDAKFYYGEDWNIAGVGDKDMAKGAYDKVIKAFQAAKNVGLKPGHVICDVTGGRKPHSVGAALACIPEERIIQYCGSMPGQPIEPIQIKYTAKMLGVDVKGP